MKEQREFFHGTHYSQNIEKHAAPPANLEFRLLDYKPINIKAVSYKFKRLKLPDHGPAKIPRTFMTIKDPKILQLSRARNPEYYDTLKGSQANMLHTLNNIKIRDIECECQLKKTRPMFEKILGRHSAHPDNVMCYDNCRHTIIAAAKRQLKAAPTPDPKIAADFIEYAKRRIEKEIGTDLTHFGYSYADWYNHLTHSKQLAIDRVVDILTTNTPDITFQERTKTMANVYEGICKIELQKQDGKPRMVCSIPQLTKFTLGPITWQLEELCAHKLSGYCGGMNLTEMSDKINAYIDQGFTKVVEGDGSAFDNTQDVTLKEIDRYLYRRVRHSVYHVDRDLYDELTQAYYKTMDIKTKNIKNKLETLLQYSILGTVFSGDCDTTLCNTIRMAYYNIYANEKSGLKYGQDFVVFSKGDDFSVLYKPYVSDTFIRAIYDTYFLKASPSPDIVDSREYGLGQVCKFLDIGQPDSFKFCSLRSWYIDDAGHVTLTRDPAKMAELSRYSRKTLRFTVTQRVQYFIDQATALFASYKGITYFDTMAGIYLQQARRIYDTCSPKQQAHILHVLNSKLTTKPDSRIHTDANDPIHNIDELFLDIAHRVKQNKIIGNYWDTMKRIEAVNVRQYTHEQLTVINSQINTEFDHYELKNLLM